MNRLLTFLLFTLALLSIGTTPVAHAVEQVICIEVGKTAHVDLDQGGGDSQGTGKSDNALQHQHGGCHGHHFASLADGSAIAGLVRPMVLRVGGPTTVLTATGPDPVLRPPQA